MSFQCPECGMVSHNPNDEANQYCGACKLFLADSIGQILASLPMPPQPPTLWHRWNRETDEVTPDRAWTDQEYNQRFESERRVARSWVGPHSYQISTVFLALDNNFSGGAPIFFETMLFGSETLLDYQRRYHTGKEAKAGHERILRLLKFLTRAPMASQKNIVSVLYGVR